MGKISTTSETFASQAMREGSPTSSGGTMRQTTPSSTTITPTTGTRTSSTSSGGDGGIKLRKELGLFNGVAIILGVIIGSGIFVSPTGVLAEINAVVPAILVWIACGILSMIGALCYAELGTSIPQSGGDYAYIKEAFGGLPAFLFLWVALFIIMPAGNAISALTLAKYVLVPFFGSSCPPSPAPLAEVGLAAAAVLFLTFINCYNVKWATFVQDTFTTTKVLALVLIIGAGAVHAVKSYINFDDSWLPPSNETLMGTSESTAVTLLNDKNQQRSRDIRDAWTNPWEGMSTSPGHIALSFYSGLFSYAGYNCLNFVTEELKDPYRNLPRAIYISLPTVTIIYVLANVAYFIVLSPAEVLNSPTVAVTFGDEVFHPAISWIMPLFVACSTFGGLNGGIFASSRLLFVGAREGHLPSFLAMINVHYFTPMPALIFLGILTLAYLSVTQSLFVLINYTAFSESLFVTFSVGALIWLRWQRPDIKRPIKVNIILPIFFFVVCAFLVFLPFFVSWMETGIGLLIVLSGIPVYFVTIGWKKKPQVYEDAVTSFTRFIQKFLLCVGEGEQNEEDNISKSSKTSSRNHEIE